MRVIFDTTNRKDLVAAIAEVTGFEKKYLGVPKCNYQVGPFIIDKNCELTCDDKELSILELTFIAALCKMSLEQKRISAKAKEYENEKYAFRCFLLRLGFIGDEYKADRKLLLRNLSGSSAFKNGQKGGEE